MTITGVLARCDGAGADGRRRASLVGKRCRVGTV
jgi:hypothetical protein